MSKKSFKFGAVYLSDIGAYEGHTYQAHIREGGQRGMRISNSEKKKHLLLIIYFIDIILEKYPRKYLRIYYIYISKKY